MTPTLTALDSANRPHWRLTDPTIRARSLAIGGPVLATATFAGRPYLLDATSGTPLTWGVASSAFVLPPRRAQPAEKPAVDCDRPQTPSSESVYAQ